jgi:hypothetical protein
MARIKVYILIILALALFSAADTAKADSENSQEYQVKAAFLYNFINFVDWPKEKVTDSNNLIIIGIIGRDPFGQAFAPLKNKQTKGKKVLINRFISLEESKLSSDQAEAVRKCYLLFVCRSEKEQLKEIINLVQGHSVLIVGDMNGFLESGGMINFMIEDKRVCFEICNTAAKQTKLNFRSKLLRLAKRVIEEDGAEGAKD